MRPGPEPAGPTPDLVQVGRLPDLPAPAELLRPLVPPVFLKLLMSPAAPHFPQVAPQAVALAVPSAVPLVVALTVPLAVLLAVPPPVASLALAPAVVLVASLALPLAYSYQLVVLAVVEVLRYFVVLAS